MCKTVVLVSTHAAGLIKLVPHANLSTNHACTTASGIMNASLGRSSYTTIENFGMAYSHLSEHQNVGEAANPFDEVSRINGELFSCPLCTKLTMGDSSVNAIN